MQRSLSLILEAFRDSVAGRLENKHYILREFVKDTKITRKFLLEVVPTTLVQRARQTTYMRNVVSEYITENRTIVSCDLDHLT